MFPYHWIEAFTVVTARVLSSCDVASCGALWAARRFGGSCRHRVESRRVNQTGNQHESNINQRSVYCLLHVGFLLRFLTVKLEAVRSSEASIYFHLASRRSVSEDKAP
jgi:hypothetical protein